MTDADVECIARKLAELQRAAATKPGTGASGAGNPDDTNAKPIPYVGTSVSRVVVPGDVGLPPPQGSRETRFGLPLLTTSGPATVTYRSGGGSSFVDGSRSFEVPTPDERYFLLRSATGGSASGAGMSAPVRGPSPSDRLGARLLRARGHSAAALQDDVAYGDRERSLLLGTSAGFVSRGGGGGPAEVRTLGGRSYLFGGGGDQSGAGAVQEVVPGWLALVAAQGKFSIAASSAANATFAELHSGRANTLRKGFNADSLDIKNKMSFGSLSGYLRAAYFSSPSGADSHLELLHAYGEAKIKDIESDPKERMILRLGANQVPVGFYNESEWESWSWAERPLVYGRLFNGNLKGTGIDLLIRPEVHRSDRDLLLWVGVFNGDSEGLPGFLTTSDKNRIGYYPTSDLKRYTLTDFVYFADVAGVIDLTPSSSSALLLHGGGFGLYGPNGTGEEGDTAIYGARARLAWLRCRRPTPGVADGLLVEAEWVRRDYHVDQQGAVAPRDLEDSGGYVSAVYTVDRAVPGRLSFGAKYDFVRSDGDNAAAAGAKVRSADPLRADRTRWTGLVSWEPETTTPVLGKFAFSLEYVYDEAEFLGEDKHSVILGLQVR